MVQVMRIAKPIKIQKNKPFVNIKWERVSVPLFFCQIQKGEL